MPTELATLLRDAPRYRSTAVVRADRITSARTWRTAHGSVLSAAAGDWLVTDGTDEWTVDDAIFGRTYRRLPDGRFRKEGSVRAVRCDRALVVPTLEGEAAAEPGDWVLVGVDGEMWPVTDSYFTDNYEPL